MTLEKVLLNDLQTAQVKKEQKRNNFNYAKKIGSSFANMDIKGLSQKLTNSEPLNIIFKI